MRAPAASAAWPLLGNRVSVRMRLIMVSRSGSWPGWPRTCASGVLLVPALLRRDGAPHAGRGVARHRADERVRARGVDRERSAGCLAALGLDLDGARRALGEREVVGDA